MATEPEPFDRSRSSAATTKEERVWGMLCHLSTFAGYAVLFGQIIGPLVIWLLKKDEFPFVDEQGKEALNFRITMYIYVVISAILVLVIIGFFLLAALAIFDLVVTLIAAIKAYEGVAFRYPLTIRFIR